MRKLFRKYLPDADQVRRHRAVAMFGPLLQHPNLWHLNRRSVSGGVAVGMFAGMIPGSNPVQFTAAALLAIAARVNLPVAVLVTLYTNPLTIVPLYILAYEYGRLILGEADNRVTIQPFQMDWSHWLDSMRALADWTLALGKPLGVGLVALALTLALAGYVAVQVGWRAYVVLAWRARREKRRQRAAAR
jgi:hypothetical protein